VRLNRPLLFSVLAACGAAIALRAAVLVTLSSTSLSLTSGQSITLTALVTGATDRGVTWSISSQAGTLGIGNPADSTGTSTNNYVAPATITQRQNVTITAASVADNTKSASVTIQLSPSAITVSPSTATLTASGSQQFTATGGGAGYVWSISPQTGTIDQTGLYTAPSTISSSQTVTVTATSSADSSISGTAKITLSPTASVSVSISPTSASLTAGGTQQFTATVSNGSTNAVTWKLSPQTGTIDSSGLYTAPALVSVTTKVTVTATAVADGTKSASATVTLNTVTDVGTGAPTTTLQNAFVNAFFRNNFNNLVSLPPAGAVKRLGTSGYVQEFNDAASSGAKLALATASSSAPSSGDGTTSLVVQLYANLYSYYTTVGAGTAGLPLYDTQSCPTIDAVYSCTYDYFDNKYVLFAYNASLSTGQNFTIRNTFYTEWTGRGGISGLGRPIDVETAVTASTKTTATSQAFISGTIYTISSGQYNGKTFTVAEPIYSVYAGMGGPGGTLGLPIAAEITLSSGVHRQTFEGGILEYTPGVTDPTQRAPVASVQIGGAQTVSTITLNQGDSLTVTATPLSSFGVALTDRPVSWSTSSSRVISIEASGATAVLHAAGGGVATVTATSEGILSPKLSFLVIAPCCQVGDGAPASVQSSFQDALTRNKITAQLPVAGPALRLGSGYVQAVQASDGTTWWIAQSDKVGTAYVVGGLILEKYQALGGPSGALGYPTSDRSAGGTQTFENSAALAGNPVRLVSGGVLAKWTSLGLETGSAGAPTADAVAFSTFGANSGTAQAFTGGSIYSASAGPRSGQRYYVTGLILTRYNALGGPGGDFGMPVSDEFVTGALHQQNFEGGNITWSSGDAAAAEHASAKTPGVVVSPATLTAGGQARLAIVGFANGSTLRVSVTGEPDFTVTTANGAYSWDMFVPLATRSGTATIRAVDTNSSAAASGSLAIKGFNDNRVAIAKAQGDNQTGLPGALLPLSVRIVLRDSSGAAVTGAAVTFEASSGASVLTPTTVTDSAGQAETYVRLQSQEGVALVRADAAGVASASVTFGVRSAASTLSNFPKLQQAGTTALGNGTATIAQKGALLTAVASILRYHQNRNELPVPNGTADLVLLNAFLKANNGFFSNPDSGEQVVNLWRAADFTGGADVEIGAPTTAAIADLLGAGSPVLISLGLSRNGVLAGGHYVVGIGVASGGSIVIQDPNPFFARTSLSDYLNGFTVGADRWTADLRGITRYVLNSPGGTRFLAAAISQPAALMSALVLEPSSTAGSCGRPVDLMDAVDSSGAAGAAGALISRAIACDGTQTTYQLRVGAGQAFRALVADLAAGGSTTDVSGSALATYKLTRPKLLLVVAPQDISFDASAVVGGATFTPGIAPGGIVSIFGSGLSGAGKQTTLDLDGTSMNVLFATPFQINAEVPLSTSPGTHTLRIQSAFGTAQQQVQVSAVAPAIFLAGTAGVITDTNYALIGPSNPLVRGQTLIIFATGLGAVQSSGGLSVTAAPVTVLVNGVELPAAFAGLAPGFHGLYQVNVLIPGATAPGLGISLTLKVGGQLSNTVALALQ
jgi:uncharacterized protein (TIGR03437 family)